MSPNPLLGEYSGLNFEVSAQHVEDAIPVLVNQTDAKFTEFEANLKGMIIYLRVCLLLDNMFCCLDLEKYLVDKLLMQNIQRMCPRRAPKTDPMRWACASNSCILKLS